MSDSLKNLFILKSPLQIINALEAVEYFQLKNNIFVLIYSDSEVNEKQMRGLLKLNSNNEVIHIKKTFKSKLLQYVRLVKQFRKSKYNYVFFGEIGKFHKVLIANIKKEKVYLLDDGTVTIKFYNEVIKTNKYNTYKFKELRFLLFGLNVKMKDKINLFTYFDLEPIHGIEVVKNRLINLKKNFLKDVKQNNNVIYFIGEALDDINVLTRDIYITLLESLIKKFSKKIIYIPHRYESQVLRDRVSGINNPLFEVISPNKPIEMYFLENKIYPPHIISCSSTALTTLSMIYDDCIVNVINISEESSDNKEYFDNFLREFYTGFSKEQLITFDELGMKRGTNV